jgi:hypothetical protein
MSNYVCLLIFIFLLSCQNLAPQNREGFNKRSDSSKFVDDSEKANEGLKDTNGFFLDCQKWSGSSMGYLQEVESSKDSLGPFCFYESYDGKETFEAIFAYKDFVQRKNVDQDSVWNSFKNGCSGDFKDFQCFVFAYPMRDPDKQKDIHALNVDFPVTVRVYKRLNMDHWQHLETVKVKAFKELATIQFNALYGIK